MDISPRMQKFIDHRLMEVGAQWNRPLSWPHLQIVVTCDSTSPEAFYGELRMAGQVLLKTDSTDDNEKAFRAAEQAFTAKMVALFRE